MSLLFLWVIENGIPDFKEISKVVIDGSFRSSLIMSISNLSAVIKLVRLEVEYSLLLSQTSIDVVVFFLLF